MSLYMLSKKRLEFPSPNLADEDGLLAFGGDLSVQRLVLAYSSGIFPWFSDGSPIMWWSPDPRLVLIPEEFKLSESLLRVIKSGEFEITTDTAFAEVIDACSSVPRKDQDGTWITDSMKNAYIQLHNEGYAHSFEVWKDGVLSGGLYGISLGKAFFGESMFHKVSNASKVATWALVRFCQRYDFKFIDAQVTTEHLLSLGAKEISREEYLRLLSDALNGETMKGTWLSSSRKG